MAKKTLAAATPKRRRRRTTKPVTRRRRRTLRAGSAAIKASANDVIMGAIGGAIAGFVIENVGFIKTQSDTNKALILGAVAIATGAFLKKPAVAAGMAGVAAKNLMKGTGILADNGSMYIPRIAAGGGSMPLQRVPVGLAQSADYAGLNENGIYASNYANQF